MQTQTNQTAIAPTAHQLRLRAIVKRLVIDLGYLEHYSEHAPGDPCMSVAASYMDDAIAAINQSFDPENQKITPVVATGVSQEISPVVYPSEEP